MASRRRGAAGDPFGNGQDYDLESVSNALYGDIQKADQERVIRRAVDLDELTFDPTIQVRLEGTNLAHLQMLTQVLLNGGEFRDPIILFRDDEGRLFVADGWHRAEATRSALKKTPDVAPLMAEIRPGGYPAALEYAEGANLRHGLALSMKSKRAIFERRLKRGHAWATLSDRLIAKELGVDHKTIGAWRSSLTGEFSPVGETEGRNQSSDNTRVSADGHVRRVDRIRRANVSRAKPKSTPPVQTFTPDDIDQTLAEDEPYQDVTPPMQPGSDVPGAEDLWETLPPAVPTGQFTPLPGMEDASLEPDTPQPDATRVWVGRARIGRANRGTRIVILDMVDDALLGKFVDHWLNGGGFVTLTVEFDE
jgi:hypothetical protein